jgi:hypothetical protein
VRTGGDSPLRLPLSMPQEKENEIRIFCFELGMFFDFAE